MGKKLIVPIKVYVTVELDEDFDDIDEAIDSCCEDVFLESYAGNGSCEKIVGTSNRNITLEANQEADWDDAEFIE